MSKHGPCFQCPEQAVAWLHFEGGARTVRLCRLDLDAWFDAADDHPEMEPRIWGWFVKPEPPAAEVTAWAQDPRNHQAVAEVLRREARIRPDWLRDFLDREDRAARGGAGRLVLQ